MKIMTIIGTRPEIIRLSRIFPKLDRHFNHVLVHTGQNYDVNLKDVFFEELGVRKPDYYLGAGGSFGEQIGKIFVESQYIMSTEKPDKLLLLGDTNSALTAILAKRMGILVYHMEAGNRCYDDRVPEEVNRRVIDHSSDILMPYTERSRQNLVREGIPGERICVTGNPIFEVIRHYKPQIDSCDVLNKLDLEEKKYFLVTMHREENVDVQDRLEKLTSSLDMLQKEYGIPVIVSTHPRTRNRMERFGVGCDNHHVRYLSPFGFFEFIALEWNALCALSDSGTVQEECAILNVPNVTLRDVTERPETIECGSNLLSGVEPEAVLRCVRTVLDREPRWTAPAEYLVENVSDRVTNILMGHYCRSRYPASLV
jgi:UDP-N-acetylglucosamine 2-epimerase (non-hydrolysing)